MPRAAARSALGAAHQLGSRPLGPRRELLRRCGTERVAGSHQHGAPGIALLGGHLADRRGLPHTVHADEHPHVRAARATRFEVQHPIATGQPRRHVLAQRVEQLIRVGDLLGLHARPQVVHERIGDTDTDVGTQQRLLEVEERVIGDR
jgi:hypothetical protein